MELKDLILKTDGKVTIELGNLSPEAPVNFKVISADKNNKTDTEAALKVKMFRESELNVK